MAHTIRTAGRFTYFCRNSPGRRCRLCPRGTGSRRLALAATLDTARSTPVDYGRGQAGQRTLARGRGRGMRDRRDGQSACRSIEWRGDPGASRPERSEDQATVGSRGPGGLSGIAEKRGHFENGSRRHKVRPALEITPKFLAAARMVAPALPDATPGKPAPQRSAAQKKGRT